MRLEREATRRGRRVSCVRSSAGGPPRRPLSPRHARPTHLALGHHGFLPDVLLSGTRAQSCASSSGRASAATVGDLAERTARQLSRESHSGADAADADAATLAAAMRERSIRAGWAGPLQRHQVWVYSPGVSAHIRHVQWWFYLRIRRHSLRVVTHGDRRRGGRAHQAARTRQRAGAGRFQTHRRCRYVSRRVHLCRRAAAPHAVLSAHRCGGGVRG